MSDELVATGGGLGLGLDNVTREFSDLGAAANPGSPAESYADDIAGTDAAERARECAEG